MPNPLFFTASRAQRIGPEHSGRFAVLGNVSAVEGGHWRVQFYPDDLFSGSLTPVGRSAGKDAHDADVGFGTVPYRRVQMNGVASDRAIVSDGNPIATDFIIEVPASGLSIALLIDVSVAGGLLLTQPLSGPSPT